jgi:hypothetical protein
MNLFDADAPTIAAPTITNSQIKMLDHRVVKKISYYDFVLTDQQKKWLNHLKYLFLAELPTNYPIEILIPDDVSIISLTILMMELQWQNLETSLVARSDSRQYLRQVETCQFYRVLSTHLIVSIKPIIQKINYSLPLTYGHIEHIDMLTNAYLSCIKSGLPSSIPINDITYVASLSIIITTLNHLNYQTKLIIKLVESDTELKVPVAHLQISNATSSKL